MILFIGIQQSTIIVMMKLEEKFKTILESS
jgi:hypothetical protein